MSSRRRVSDNNNISQLLRDSFSVYQQPPIWEPPSHYSMSSPTSNWNTFIQPFSLYSPFLTSSNICHMSEGIWTRVEHRTPQWSHFVGTIHCEAGHNNPGSPDHCWHAAQRLMDLFFVSWNWNRLLLINLVRTRFLRQYFYLKLSGKTEKYIYIFG